MKGKDEIKELFQKELGNYQAKVDPSLWNGIQAGLGTAGAAAGVGSSLGLVGKIIIGASVAAAITVGTVLIVNNNSPQKDEKSITELTTKDSVKNESVEKPNIEEGRIHNSPISETISEEDSSKENEVNSVQKDKKQAAKDASSLELRKITKDNNFTSEETTNNQLDKVIVYQEKPTLAPSVKLENNKEENNSVDLSKVHIEIVKQNNQYVSFSANEVPNDAQITWNFGDGKYERSSNPEHFFGEPGIYTVVLTVQSRLHEVSKTIKVDIQMKGEVGSLPNVFTPNGDGRNDEFFIECKHLKSFQLTVLDNTQNVVYSTNDVNFRWDGMDKFGVPVKDGNYVYIIVAEDETGNVINKYQHLHIQR